MATVYALKGMGAGISYNYTGLPVIKADLDVAELILNPALLALAASPNDKLTAFAGFLSGDSVKIAKIPKGFLATHSAIKHKRAEATVTGAIGDSDNAGTFNTALSLNSASDCLILAQAGGAKVYNAEDYILVTFAAAGAVAAAFSINLFGMLIE